MQPDEQWTEHDQKPTNRRTLLTLCCGRRTDLLCFISQCQVPVLFFVLNLSGDHLKEADPKDSSKPAKHRTGSSMFPRFLLFRAPKHVCHIQYKHFKSQASQDSADSWLSRSFYVAFTRRCGCLFGRPFDKAFALLGTGTSCTMGTWCKPQTLCLDGTSWYIMVPCPVANKVMSNPKDFGELSDLCLQCEVAQAIRAAHADEGSGATMAEEARTCDISKLQAGAQKTSQDKRFLKSFEKGKGKAVENSQKPCEEKVPLPPSQTGSQQRSWLKLKGCAVGIGEDGTPRASGASAGESERFFRHTQDQTVLHWAYVTE